MRKQLSGVLAVVVIIGLVIHQAQLLFTFESQGLFASLVDNQFGWRFTNDHNSFRDKKWAYSFLIAGCNPAQPDRYAGMLYNIMIVSRILHSSGTKADVIVMIQMSPDIQDVALSAREEQLLAALDVKIQYLAKPTSTSNFYEAQYQKFAILTLTQYDRVLYMDSDVMPFYSMDYLFELSDPLNSRRPSLRGNVIFAWRQEPASGGMFLLTPGLDHHQEIQKAIARRETEALQLNMFPPFNETIGWGHIFQGGNDCWKNIDGKCSKLWNFYGAFGDQGLIYYYTKYLRRDVSIVVGRNVEHWIDVNGVAYFDSAHHGLFSNATWTRSSMPFNSPPPPMSHYGPPYDGFVHFTGKNKPWFQSGRNGTMRVDPRQTTNGLDFWWQMLFILQDEFNLTIPYGKLAAEPPFGFVNAKHMLVSSVGKRNLTNYEDEMGSS